MPKSYQFENKSNEFAFKCELNPHENKMFESIPDINSKSKVVPFKEYSNASKVMKSSNSKEDEIMKFSNKQPNFLNSNYKKQRDSLKNNEKFRKFNILYENSSSNKLVSGETNMELNSFDSPRLQPKNGNKHLKDHESPIEETKYASVRQVTNASIIEREDTQNKMFFDRHKQTPVQTIEEAEFYNINSKKEWDRTNSNQNSFS